MSEPSAAPPRAQRRAKTEVSQVENWLLDQGVPFVVRYAADHRTIARLTPGLVLIFITGLSFLIARLTVGNDDPELSIWTLIRENSLTTADYLGMAIIMAVGFLVGIAAGFWLSRYRDHGARLLGASPGLVMVGGMFLICVVHAIRYTSWKVFFGDLGVFVALLILLYLFVRGGISALLVWALRRAVPRYQDLIRLLTRALPLQLVLVAFLFLSTEAWQVSQSLSIGHLWAMVGFFAGAALLFLVTQIPRELQKIDVQLNATTVREACQDTPLERLAERLELESVTKHPLRRKERLNLILNLAFAQGVQVFTLGMLMFVSLVGFGAIAINRAVIRSWVGSEPQNWMIFGVDTQISLELIRVAIMVASFTALQFAVLAVTDAAYRGEFFDSMVGQLEQTLVAREVYLASLDQHELVPRQQALFG